MKYKSYRFYFSACEVAQMTESSENLEIMTFSTLLDSMAAEYRREHALGSCKTPWSDEGDEDPMTRAG
jgi:hypothetical protein